MKVGQETNLLCRRIPNCLCRYSSLREGEPPPLKCRLWTVTSFQRVVWKTGGRVPLKWRYLTSTPSAQVIKLTSTVIIMLIACTLDTVWWEWHFMVFIPQTHKPSLTMSKTSDKPKLMDVLQNTSYWPVLFITVRVQRNQGDMMTEYLVLGV